MKKGNQENKKLTKEEKRVVKAEKKEMKKKNKKKIDKMRIATKIIASIMAMLMILGIAGSFLYYFLRLI